MAQPAKKDERTDPPLRVSATDGVLRIVLASPPANALSLSLMEALIEALDGAAADATTRVVVIAAGGGKVFSAGHDLKEMTAHRADGDGGRAFFEYTFATCSRLMQAIVALPRPVIAEIDGIATAAGCQLVASCDLAIATDRSRFGVNGIDVGLFCHTPAVALSRKIKPNHAMEMLLTGEMIDAVTAREFGLVNRVVPPEYLNQVIDRYTQAIAAKSPLALAMGKRSFHSQLGLPLAEAYGLASTAIVDNMMAHDADEGIAAFLGRRRPEWRGE